MISIEELYIEEPVEVSLTMQDILDDIKDMVARALVSAKRYLAGATLLTFMSLPIGDTFRSIIIEDNSEPVEITIPIKETPGSLQIASFSTERLNILSMIDHLSSITDGWDGELAKRPSKKALLNTRFLVDQLPDNILASCGVFASNDAGVFLQGRMANGKLTVYMNDNMMTYVLKGKPGKFTASVPVSIETVEYLNNGLKMYV